MAKVVSVVESVLLAEAGCQLGVAVSLVRGDPPLLVEFRPDREVRIATEQQARGETVRVQIPEIGHEALVLLCESVSAGDVLCPVQPSGYFCRPRMGWPLPVVLSAKHDAVSGSLVRATFVDVEAPSEAGRPSSLRERVNEPLRVALRQKKPERGPPSADTAKARKRKFRLN